jgi:hypothetical protein
MPRKQTRRAISVKGLTYQRLKKHCDKEDKSISGFVEDLVAAKLDALGVPQETVLEPRPVRQKSMGDYKGSHFTF